MAFYTGKGEDWLPTPDDIKRLVTVGAGIPAFEGLKTPEAKEAYAAWAAEKAVSDGHIDKKGNPVDKAVKENLAQMGQANGDAVMHHYRVELEGSWAMAGMYHKHGLGQMEAADVPVSISPGAMKPKVSPQR